MPEPARPTIFALSSGRPPAAIAVVRISGQRAGKALGALGVKIPEPRKAALARIRDPRTEEIIDEALALWFPAPHSETGEDVAELQLHGGRAVIAAVLDALSQLEGLRPAEAGEFTRRGFENGKLDLTAVEGLADLVNAETEGQRRLAFRQMKGRLGNRAEDWRHRLIQALAMVEARIDFSDEADVPEDLVAPALTIARELADEIAAALADGHRGERLREGLVVAIAGPPNAGKSTLLNRIAQREAAIVSPYAGTTRDVIEVHLDLGGLPMTLLDTAGIRASEDPVEVEGVRRARERAAAADLVLWVVDASAETEPQEVTEPWSGSMAAPATGPAGALSVPGALSRAMAERNEPDLRPGPPMPVASAPGTHSAAGTVATAGIPALTAAPFPSVWRVHNKIDLIKQDDSRSEPELLNIDRSEPKLRINQMLKSMDNKGSTHKSESTISNNDFEFIISATTGEGFDLLLTQLARHAEAFLAGAEQSLVTRVRHRRALEDALAALRRALGDELAGHEDLLAEELRAAANALARLTGRVDVEDILDVIFRDFCIGK